MKENEYLPCEEILSDDGWSTGLCYLTEKTRYPHAKDVLEKIIFWSKYAQRDLKSGVFIEEEKEEIKNKKRNLINKLSKAIEKATKK